MDSHWVQTLGDGIEEPCVPVPTVQTMSMAEALV
jgi:hypothetical protein